MNRPGGNLTGVSFLTVLTVAKRLELLSELVPDAVTVAVLLNSGNPNAERSAREDPSCAICNGRRLS
jgi:ABC-type uncharacterized transport system substrate-binding protein